LARKRHAEEQWLVSEHFEPAVVRQSRVSEPKFVITTRLAVDERIEAELLDESLELAQRSRALVEIHEMCLDSTLGEESQRLAGLGALFHPEDLNFHRMRWSVIDGDNLRLHGDLRFVSSSHRSEYIYRPAWWVPGPHGQTLWGKFFRRHPPLPIRMERWDTPDGDFIDVHRLDAPAGATRLLILHGLEGTIESHYVGGFFGEAERRGWAADLLIFRGCGAEPNRAPRFYHSGETGDLAFVLSRIQREHPDVPILIAGVSLGGNVLLKYLGECGTRISPRVRAAATVSVPYDLERAARFIERGFSRIYNRHFVQTLRLKARTKLDRFPGLFDHGALERARTIYAFDDAVTAPVHGFLDAHDYYRCSSALAWIDRVSIPTLLLSAVDDPFLPREVLDDVKKVAGQNEFLHLEFVRHGGHVGFVSGRWPWRPFYYAERRVCEFLARWVDAAAVSAMP
jgi:predicted alpha/beta-fold hydrolase